MKTVVAFWAFCVSIVLGLLIWRNRVRYYGKTWLWIGTKSVIETGILILSAVRLPALLCAWVGLWISKPIKATWLKVTVGVIVGSFLGFLSMFGMEILLLISVFAVDEVTGEDSGFLKNWGRAKKYDDARLRVREMVAA